jgi:hypothetical protein
MFSEVCEQKRNTHNLYFCIKFEHAATKPLSLCLTILQFSEADLADNETDMNLLWSCRFL